MLTSHHIAMRCHMVNVLKVLNHKILRIILILMCALCMFPYILEIKDEKRILSLDEITEREREREIIYLQPTKVLAVSNHKPPTVQDCSFCIGNHGNYYHQTALVFNAMITRAECMGKGYNVALTFPRDPPRAFVRDMFRGHVSRHNGSGNCLEEQGYPSMTRHIADLPLLRLWSHFVRKQLNVASSAEITQTKHSDVMMAHGAGQTNLMYLDKETASNTNIIEVCPPYTHCACKDSVRTNLCATVFYAHTRMLNVSYYVYAVEDEQLNCQQYCDGNKHHHPDAAREKVRDMKFVTVSAHSLRDMVLGILESPTPPRDNISSPARTWIHKMDFGEHVRRKFADIRTVNGRIQPPDLTEWSTKTKSNLKF